jgi:hypothetical protein
MNFARWLERFNPKRRAILKESRYDQFLASFRKYTPFANDTA